ncbi:MAG: methyltransferase domain-containing protein [Acidobacteriota bacterium]
MFIVLAHRDRYGYAATAHACRRCGLVFLNPVMTAEAYGAFYAGVYRPLVSAYHGRLIDATTVQAEQRAYAAERSDLIAPYVERLRGGRLLDVGGSTGVVAYAFCSRFGLTGTVIDPAPAEIAEARALGLETVSGFVEDYRGEGRFEVIAMCQTVDHLLDITGSLAALRALLADHGVLFIDIVDFRAAYLRNWSVEEAVKIDHPYYLTPFTMETYLRRAGFQIARVDFAADHLHVGYVCVPGEAEPEALPAAAEVARLVGEIRYVQNVPRS